MRYLFQFVCVTALAGCFSPHIVNGGFACDPTQTPSCPSGFFCVNDRCVDQAGGGGGGGDSQSPNDLSMISAPADLSAPHDLAHGGGGGADLASGNSCAHSLCISGVKLTSGCDPCVTQICAQDSYCCVTKWSSQCVTEVTSICARSCP